MDQMKITGGVPLHGRIEIGGAKNSASPLMTVSLLTDQTVTLSNIPHLSDITTMAHLLVSLGVELSVDGSHETGGHTGRVLKLNAGNVTSTTAPYDIVRKMRASIIVLGPLLTRFHNTRVSLPGGCAIGVRPINYHLDAFEKMGAEIKLREGYIEANAPNGLKGAVIDFPEISVGATENVMLTATLADGTTILNNAAREPEITDLANCLNRMGADIKGAGTDSITINGVKKLGAVDYKVIADRIEAGTYAVAAAITGGEIELVGISPDIMRATLDVLEQAGVDIKETADGLVVCSSGRLQPIKVETRPYPGLATDMQAQIMALMCLADGTSEITENIFENRFMHVPELNRMGAGIMLDGRKAIISGNCRLKGAEVMATDLRASVSLLLAAMAAEGETIVNRVYHIDRGYERIEEKLAACGAKIKRTKAKS